MSTLMLNLLLQPTDLLSDRDLVDQLSNVHQVVMPGLTEHAAGTDAPVVRLPAAAAQRSSPVAANLEHAPRRRIISTHANQDDIDILHDVVKALIQEAGVDGAVNVCQA